MLPKKTINLSAHKRSKNPILSLRSKVLECLGDSIFEVITIQDLAYYTLKCFYPLNKSLANNKDSLEKACTKIFKSLPIVKGSVSVVTDTGEWKPIISNKPEESVIEKFLHTYLQFEQPPGQMLRDIEELVKQDMTEINDLIKQYEKNDFIQDYLAKGRFPRNHDERVVFDFYQRCVKEQRIITEYYLNGIKTRAIAKANYLGSEIRQLIGWSERYRDRPYHFATYQSASYFDHEKIDLLANKISDFGISEVSKLEKLYTNNKQQFYKKLFKKHLPLQIWQELYYNLQHLPLKEDRSAIFKELESLFKAKMWIGFYALALTQIEGFFSEMYLILNSGSPGTKALPDKVESARTYHEMSQYYFDYYQYHIPRLRNKFMHYGYDNDFKLKSFDLLFDLRHLLKMFTELKSPLVIIKNIHLKRRLEEFITYSDFAKYFQLLNDLGQQYRIKIKDDIESFEKDFLIEYCNAEYVSLEVVQELPKVMEKFLSDISRRIAEHGYVFNFEDRNFKKSEDAISKNKDLSEMLSDCFLFNRNESEALSSMHIFLSNNNKYLPHLQKDYKQLLDKSFQQYKVLLSNIYKTMSLLGH